MKKIILLSLITFLISCQKENVTTGTRLKVKVYNVSGSGYNSGVTVSLHTSSSNANSNSNSISSKTTDSNGEVLFGSLNESTDIWIRLSKSGKSPIYRRYGYLTKDALNEDSFSY